MRITRLRAPATAGLVLSLAVVLAGCAGSSVQNARVYQAGPRNVTASPGGIGQTAAGESVSVSVDFRDLVTDVGVRAGDQVSAGQPLLSLDPAPFQQQSAELNAKLQLLASQIQSATQREQLAASAGNAATATALAEQKNSYQAQEQIVQQQLDIAQGRTSQILSPIAGVIGQVSIQAGGYASPGTTLLTVLNLASIQVTANLPVADRTPNMNGDKATVSFPELPGVELQGAVVQVAAQTTDPTGQTFQVTILAPNTVDQEVFPGITAYVNLTVQHAAQVVISRSAVVNIDQDPTVYVVQGQTVHTEHIEIGISDGTYVEVLQGLAAGQLVIVPGNQTFNDGDAVRIVQTLQS